MSDSDAMTIYVVRQGEVVRSIALRLGIDPTDIVKHSKNSELMELRKCHEDDDECDMALLCGDLLYLPQAQPRESSIAAGSSSEFMADVPLVELNLSFYDDDGPWADEPFVVEGIDPPLVDKTDGEGRMQVSVPLTVPSIIIHFEQRNQDVVHLMRHLDPVNENSGAEQRLAALGLYCGPITPDMNDDFEAAIRVFQATQKLQVNGTLDDGTVEALDEAFRRSLTKDSTQENDDGGEGNDGQKDGGQGE
jgi:hypothetical protein